MLEYIKQKEKEIAKFMIIYLSAAAVFLPLASKEVTNPDGLSSVYSKSTDDLWELALGRFGLKIIDHAREGILNPAVETLISCVFLTFSILLVYRILNKDKKSNLSLAVYSVFMILSQTVVSMMTYYYCSVEYFFAMFIAIGVTYLVVKRYENTLNGKKYSIGSEIAHIILCGFLLSCSLSIYQAYIPLYLTLAAMYLLLQICRNFGSAELSWKKCLVFIGKVLLICIVGVILYLTETSIVNAHFETALTAGRNMDTMGKMSLSILVSKSKEAYIFFYQYFFSNDKVNNTVMHRARTNQVIIAFILFAILYAIYLGLRKNKTGKERIWHLCLTVLIVIALPLLMTSIIVMAPGVSIYDTTGILMIPAMILLYILGYELCLLHGEEIYANHKEKFKQVLSIKKGIVAINLLALFYASLILVSVDAAFWSYANFMKNKTTTYATRIVSVADNSGYDITAQPLLIVGNTNDIPDIEFYLKDIVKGTTAYYGQFWGTKMDAGCWTDFINRYLGVTVSPAGTSEEEKITNSKAFSDMPVFPEQGSMKMIDGILVVKLK